MKQAGGYQDSKKNIGGYQDGGSRTRGMSQTYIKKEVLQDGLYKAQI